MIKRTLALLLLLALLLPVAALGADPKPIPVLKGREIPPTPAGMHHYLLLCSDLWEGTSAKKPNNTDGIMLITVDTIAHRVMLTSFIRDMLIQRPDGKFGRINRVARTFSLEDLMGVLNSHFGLRIEKYILLNWTSIANIVDALGGVDITVTDGEATRLKSKYAYKSDWTTPVLKGAGTYHFRGYAAVIYMRIRSSSVVNGEKYDFRRTTRARSVVSSLADSLREVTYEEAVNIAYTVSSNIVATNMTLADILTAAGYAFELRDAQIEQMRIPINGTSHELMYAEMATQEIDYVANRDALQKFLYESFVVRDEEDDF